MSRRRPHEEEDGYGNTNCPHIRNFCNSWCSQTVPTENDVVFRKTKKSKIA
jgi:hypothetical protein